MKNKIIDFFNKYINITLVLLTLFIACGLSLFFIQDGNYIKLSSESYNILFLIFIVGIFILLKKAYSIKEKRLWICTSILSLILAITYFCGEIGNTYCNSVIPNSKKFVLYALIKIFIYFVIFDSILALIFYYAKGIVKKLNINNKEYKFFTANKKSLFLIAGLFMISYIPYFLYYYPGTIQYDAINCLEQVNGYTGYGNYQPIFYTLFLGGIWNFGKNILGSGTLGLAIYTIIQMIATSFTLSTVIFYMAKRKVAIKWRIISFLILILNPLTAMYAVRIEKSLFFNLAIILLVIGIIDLNFQYREFFQKKWKPILFSILILITSLLRNNGIYIIILMLIVLLIVCKKIRINVLCMGIIPIIIFYIIQGPILNYFEVDEIVVREAMSIPVQQFARLIKYDNDKLTLQEKENIHKYLPVEDEKISTSYDALISDDVKINFSEEAIKEDKITLVKTYFKLALKYPGQTISALLFNTYGFYAPNSYNIWGTQNFKEETENVMKDIGTLGLYGTLPDEIRNQTISEKYDVHHTSIINFDYINRLNTHITMKDIPVFSMLITSIGLYFWLLLICITYCIYSKNYRNIIMTLPILFLWLTNIAGPVVDIRYVYSMMLIMPLYIGIVFFINQEQEEKTYNEK